MCYLNATHWEVSGYTSLSLFHGGSKPSLSCSLTLAEKRLLTPSVQQGAHAGSRWQTQTAEDRHHAESVSRIVFNSTLSKMFLIHQLSLKIAQLQKSDFSKKRNDNKTSPMPALIKCGLPPSLYLMFQFRSDFLVRCSQEGFPTCWPPQQSGTTWRYLQENWNFLESRFKLFSFQTEEEQLQHNCLIFHGKGQSLLYCFHICT